MAEMAEHETPKKVLPPNKRHAPEPGAAASSSDMRAQLVESISNSVKDSLSDSIAKAIDEKMGDVDTLFASMLQEYDGKATKRFNAAEADIVELREKQEASHKSQDGIKDDIKKMQDMLCMVKEDKPPPPRADLLFDRAPDLTTLTVSAQEALTKAAAWASLASLCDEGDIPHAEVELKGLERGLAKRFSLRFMGSQLLGTNRARQFKQLLREEGGTWRNIMAQSPAGRHVKLFISDDKSEMQSRTEVAGKRLLAAMQEQHPDKHVDSLKRDSVITMDW